MYVIKDKKIALKLFFFLFPLLFKSRRIHQSRERQLLVDPDPDLLYTKRELAKQDTSCSVVDSSSGDVFQLRAKFPESGWGSHLEKMPLLRRRR